MRQPETTSTSNLWTMTKRDHRRVELAGYTQALSAFAIILYAGFNRSSFCPAACRLNRVNNQGLCRDELLVRAPSPVSANPESSE